MEIVAYNNKIDKIISSYFNYLDGIKALNVDDKVEIENSKTNLLHFYTPEKIKKVKDCFEHSINDTLFKIDNILKSNNLERLGKFYLGCVYRDFYFCLKFGVSVTSSIQYDKNSKTSANDLKISIIKLKNNVDKSINIVEIINFLEEFRDEIH